MALCGVVEAVVGTAKGHAGYGDGVLGRRHTGRGMVGLPRHYPDALSPSIGPARPSVGKIHIQRLAKVNNGGGSRPRLAGVWLLVLLKRRRFPFSFTCTRQCETLKHSKTMFYLLCKKLVLHTGCYSTSVCLSILYIAVYTGR